MLTAILTVASPIAAIVAAITGVIIVRRTPKLPEPPYEPSVVIVDTIPMNRHIRDLPGHGMSSKARVL